MDFWITTRPPSRQPNSEHKKHHSETSPGGRYIANIPLIHRRLSVRHGMQAAVHDASGDQAACSQGDQIRLHGTGHTNGLAASRRPKQLEGFEKKGKACEAPPHLCVDVMLSWI